MLHEHLKLTSKKDDDDKKGAGCWPAAAVFSFLWVCFASWMWPWSIEPFTVFSLWSPAPGVASWDLDGWGRTALPIFVWGVGVTLYFQLSNKTNMASYEERLAQRNAEQHFLGGVVVSVWAGMAEELAFRWCFFLSAIIGCKVFNWMFFGFLGFGISEHLYLWILGPVANFFTLGAMENWLFHPAHWAIGAAILAANARFRDGHKYQGLLGYLNSWFIGMFLFWCMFKFGLLGAIAIHFFYDFLIYTTVYLVRVAKR